MERKTRQYEAEGIVVEYEVARCIHAEECVHGLPEVFDVEARPWIQPGNASADAVAEVVRKCPTGALRYRRTDGGASEEPADENTLRVAADGPLYLAGRLRLELPGGEAVEETRMALCRCGDSKHKPFCDNTHVEKGFSDPGLAVEHRLGRADGDGDGALAVTLAPDGPILVRGPLKVIAADDASAEGSKAAFCRCGASASKPYCDGTHKKVGFEAD